MVARTTIASGAWDADIWSPAGIPGQDDDVTINHALTEGASEVLHNNLIINGSLELSQNHKVKNGGVITIGTGGSIYPAPTLLAQRKFYCATAGGAFKIRLAAVTPDARRICFDGYRFEGVVPTIGCVGSGIYGSLDMLEFGTADANGDYWLTEQGLPSLGAELQEANNEGVGENFASWRKGSVRSFRVAAKWPKVASGSAPFGYDYGLLLKRMVQSPYNVLVVTPSVGFLGHIENVAFGNPGDGGRHYRATISLVEGRDG